jgi:hypothetical protein
MWILDSYVFYLLTVKRSSVSVGESCFKNPVPIESLPFPFFSFNEAGPNSPQLGFTLTALCTAQTGSFFADFLSVLDKCSVAFASLVFPQKKVVQNLSLTSFAPLSSVCVESKAEQTPAFFAVTRL